MTKHGQIEYNGKKSTVREIFESNPHHPSLTYNVFNARIYKGWAIDDALNTYTIPRQRNEQKYHYKGDDLPLRDLRKKYCPDISLDHLRSRLNIGWTIEEAIETPINQQNNKRGKKYTFQGEELTLSEIHKKYKPPMTLSGLRSRVVLQGCSILEAVKVPPKKLKK